MLYHNIIGKTNSKPLFLLRLLYSVVQGSFPPRGPIAQPANQSSANSMYHGGEARQRCTPVVHYVASQIDFQPQTYENTMLIKKKILCAF